MVVDASGMEQEARKAVIIVVEQQFQAIRDDLAMSSAHTDRCRAVAWGSRSKCFLAALARLSWYNVDLEIRSIWPSKDIWWNTTNRGSSIRSERRNQSQRSGRKGKQTVGRWHDCHCHLPEAVSLLLNDDCKLTVFRLILGVVEKDIAVIRATQNSHCG
jgi:hypothetical protein